METGTQTAIETFEHWQPVHETHMKRYMGVIDRHVSIMGQWVDALKYPTNTFEHQVIVERLHRDLCALMEEQKETVESLSADYASLYEVFRLFQIEVMTNNIKKIIENENVS